MLRLVIVQVKTPVDRSRTKCLFVVRSNPASRRNARDILTVTIELESRIYHIADCDCVVYCFHPRLADMNFRPSATDENSVPDE
jgi:hypothetical protein